MDKTTPAEKTRTESVLEVATEIRAKIEEINQKLDYLIKNYRKDFCAQFDSCSASEDSED